MLKPHILWHPSRAQLYFAPCFYSGQWPLAVHLGIPPAIPLGSPYLCRIATELLPQGERSGVLRVGAPDLDDVLELLRLRSVVHALHVRHRGEPRSEWRRHSGTNAHKAHWQLFEIQAVQLFLESTLWISCILSICWTVALPAVWASPRRSHSLCWLLIYSSGRTIH